MSALLSKILNPYTIGAGTTAAGVYGVNKYDDYHTESLGDKYLTQDTTERNQSLSYLKKRDKERHDKVKAYMAKAPKKKWVPFTASGPDEISFYDDARDRMSKALPHTNEANPMYHMGRGVNRFLARPLIRPLAQSLKQGNPLTGAVAGGLVGAPLGLIIGLIRNGLSGAIPGLLKGLGLGAIGGGGLSALGNYGANRTLGMDKPFVNPISRIMNDPGTSSIFGVKSASAQRGFGSSMGNPMQYSNIYNSGISQAQRSAMMAEVRSLSPREKSTLQRLLQGAAGSAAIFIIAKYLLGLGKKTTLMSMILGGLGGYNYR